ncbi:MAG: chromosome partitioning protein ParB [Desulfosarcina sp.]|nr:chromosome partitioning protein ParB [Desulfobacterales bacterium]
MIEQIKISSFDLRYEGYRLKSRRAEKALLASIIDHGIRDPLQGVDLGDGIRILLNGFKRYRCAEKLKLSIVPYRSFGSDEPLGIIKLIRISNSKTLNILEQAKLIDELQNVHDMCNADIAGLLEKSQSWVSMRAGLLGEMSEYVIKQIFEGDFPVYSFMYTLRQFIRMNSIPKQEIDEFVKAVSGKGLSIRDIELIASGFFRGSDGFRQQIKKGNITWGLKRLKESAAETTECTKAEQSMLRELELLLSYMQRITCRIKNDKPGTDAFHAQATLLSKGIISFMDSFSKSMRAFHERCEQA